MRPEHLGIGMTSQRTRERMISRLREQGIVNDQVLEVMRTTPRHLFVDEALASRSYEDTALPIGHGQTISQPYSVARMTEALLESGPLDQVLEVGTGSGYQTAILARLVGEVFSVERIHPLLNAARRRFQTLNLFNIRTNYSDGTWGWPDRAPYHGIMATAAPADIPQALLEQLAIGGRLVAPIGTGSTQQLVMVLRTSDGYERQTLNSVRFVPMLEGTE